MNYQPGVCNIGPYEIQKRKQGLYVSIIGTVALIIGLYLLELPQFLYLLTFFGFLGISVSYLQIRNRFCVYFGLFSIVNLGGNRSDAQRIREDEFHKEDLRKVRIMLIQAIVFSIFATSIIYFLF